MCLCLLAVFRIRLADEEIKSSVRVSGHMNLLSFGDGLSRRSTCIICRRAGSLLRTMKILKKTLRRHEHS
jgi:uncharacterized phosphosugar-binding protein